MSELSQDTPGKRASNRRATAARIEIAARELCLDAGIDAVSVEAVAAAAGVSRRTCYRYFPSVADMLLASSRRSLVRISRDVRARPATETVRAAFANAFAAATVSADEATIQRLDRRLAAREPKAWARLASQIKTDTLDTFAGVIAERLPTPASPDLAILTAKVMLVFITHYFAANDTAGAMRATARDIDAALGQVLDTLIT